MRRLSSLLFMILVTSLLTGAFAQRIKELQNAVAQRRRAVARLSREYVQLIISPRSPPALRNAAYMNLQKAGRGYREAKERLREALLEEAKREHLRIRERRMTGQDYLNQQYQKRYERWDQALELTTQRRTGIGRTWAEAQAARAREAALRRKADHYWKKTSKEPYERRELESTPAWYR